MVPAHVSPSPKADRPRISGIVFLQEFEKEIVKKHGENINVIRPETGISGQTRQISIDSVYGIRFIVREDVSHDKSGKSGYRRRTVDESVLLCEAGLRRVLQGVEIQFQSGCQAVHRPDDDDARQGWLFRRGLITKYIEPPVLPRDDAGT